MFVSDARVMASSEIAALFAEAAVEVTVDDEGDDCRTPTRRRMTTRTRAPGRTATRRATPACSRDLGTPPARLLELCAEEGQLPADVISALCEAAGCLDVLEKLRGV